MWLMNTFKNLCAQLTGLCMTGLNSLLQSVNQIFFFYA